MRSKTIFSSVQNKKGSGKTPEQIWIEDKRAKAIERLKGKMGAEKKLRKLYDHLPEDQIEYIVQIFKKYEHDNRNTDTRTC